MHMWISSRSLSHLKALHASHAEQSEDGDSQYALRRGLPTKAPPRKLTANQQRKLKEEMPEIRPAATATACHASKQLSVAVIKDNEDWLSHTQIVFKSTGPQTVKIDLMSQNEEMKQVIRASIAMGEPRIVFGPNEPVADGNLESMETPLQRDYLDKLALQSLIVAADKLGFDGERDIADHLERESYPSYIKPITVVVCTFTLDM
ncbi:hypothetical protein C8Q72DRAFT_909054 [Fomitopsis betulina]|nr:hypothetical protein C8Q72DRAFT_909054 [Fomitopsis betulina]